MSPLARLFLGSGALVAVYFTVPVEITDDIEVRFAVTVALLGFVTWLIYWEMRRQMRRAESPLWGLGLAMVAGVMAFALTDYVIAHNYPGQFEGLATRLDGLYFALTTLATVGYGDVHAAGQLARAVVSVQQIFNIVVVTTAASVLVGELRARAKARSRSASE